MLRKLLVGLALVLVVVVGGAVAYLLAAPPDLLRVATGYSAKMVCSNVFIAGRDASEVMAVDVQAPGHPLLRHVDVEVDEPAGIVTARLLGLIAPAVAVHRPGLGCASVPDGNVEKAKAVTMPPPPAPAPRDGVWPEGDRIGGAVMPALAEILSNEGLTGPGMRAVVVVKNGRIVGEAYGEGFNASTPLLGWSMTKTVNAALMGILKQQGVLDMNDAALVPAWSDGRKDIRLRDLLGMESGLQFNEEYGDVSDVLRMLFLQPDMATYAASFPAVDAPDTRFNYSSGTATLLARIWMDRLGDQEKALAFPRTALFEPLGMQSAVMEADETGTFVGSSYMYATARDWARFGLFLLRDGVWYGERLLPEGWVALMDESNGLDGDYSQMQTWITGPRESDGLGDAGLPPDTFWAVGHDGQTIAVIPSEDLVVVRLGLTPSKLLYWPEKLTKAAMETLR